MNPWQSVPLNAYESHMSLESVGQAQAIDALIEKRLKTYLPRSVAIWGIAGGNGLRHIDKNVTELVVGVDVNADYIAAARERYIYLGDKLVLIQANLNEPADLPRADMVIADLFIEYLGIDTFCERVSEAAPKTLCCVIQKNYDAAFVSSSPYMAELVGIGTLHNDIDEKELVHALGRPPKGYHLLYRDEVPLMGAKSFIRLDFLLPD